MLPDVFALSVHPSAASVGVVGVGDPEATRTVYASVVILILLGVVLAVLAVWVFRRTRPEPELLAPLETMNTRGWRKLDPAAQRRSLDESRPTGAMPMRREASAPPVDTSFATVAPVASFDDLSERAKRASASETEPLDPTSADETAPIDRDASTDEASDTADDSGQVLDEPSDEAPSDAQRASDDAVADDDTDAGDGSRDGDEEVDPTSSTTSESVGPVVPDRTEVAETETETETSIENGELRRGEPGGADDDDTGEIVDDDGLGLDHLEFDEPDVIVPIDPLLAQQRASADPSS